MKANSKNAFLLSTVLVLCVLFAPFTSVSEATDSTPSISAQSAIVIELNSASVLYSKSAHEKLPMASTTKVMTALVAIEQGNLDDMVVTDTNAYGVEGSSIYLNRNEKMSLRDLLYGLMLRSGNDAAVAIACHIGGSVDGFVKLMNERAAQLGALNTCFLNPHGLPAEGHYTTAYDLALICREAMKNPVFKEITGTQYHSTTTGTVTRSMMNKNKLLWECDGAIGIKTGYTIAAGKCLTFAATRNGMTIVGVVLNCPNMFPDAISLIDYAFNEYELYEVIRAGNSIVRIQIANGYRDLLALNAETDISVPIKKSEGISLIPQIELNENIQAPIMQGEKLGTLNIYHNGSLMGSSNLIAAKSIYTPNYQYYFERLIRGW